MGQVLQSNTLRATPRSPPRCPDHPRVPDPGTLRHHPSVDAVLVGRARDPLAKMRQAHAGARDGVRYALPPPHGPAAGDDRGHVVLQDLTPRNRST